jgi:hypothetical protein
MDADVDSRRDGTALSRSISGRTLPITPAIVRVSRSPAGTTSAA